MPRDAMRCGATQWDAMGCNAMGSNVMGSNAMGSNAMGSNAVECGAMCLHLHIRSIYKIIIGPENFNRQT
ncbi:hypothetical protein [Pseudoduganella umbonata]|uniref:Uncharacterized protein n=1 Tax=Pseudoduganella umbonata TaxID=864828 RepID=A0A4P8HJE6_9BURK|nr:hypothetical protein [Pseudoduganella umbonata]MBB3219652.1 hypothetical protein [Pseudoduganella umbonata]QCP09713.1 hypothetical protein FCL38_04210 [Pseudoduganella umbonata]